MINKKLLKSINKSGYGEIVGTTTHDTLLNRDKAEQHTISAITDLQTTLDAKQAKLTAGTNITITDDVISATGDVTLDTAQTITGVKTFSNNVVMNKNLNFEITGSNATFLEWKKDGTRLAFFGKGSSSSDAISLDVTNDLSITAANIKFNSKELKEVGTPTANNSAATKKYVDDGLTLKQNKLTAGTNITIVGDTISSSGGTGTGDVTLDTTQTFTGAKTFNANVEIDGTNYLYFGDKNKHIRNSMNSGNSLEVATVDDKPIDFYANSTKRMSISSASIDVFNTKIVNVGAPTTDKDAANKEYVDTEIAKALKPYKEFMDTLMKNKGENYDK